MTPTFLKRLGNDLLHFIFPRLCPGCGSDLLPQQQSICTHCYTTLPETGFAALPGNPVEKIFYGRVPVEAAMSSYYFTKSSALQHMVHALKYKGNTEAGEQLGRWMGLHLQQSQRFAHNQLLVPLPLFTERLRRRGYNQATVLCKGIAEVTGATLLETAVERIRYTATQTRKGRTERWHNVHNSFAVAQPAPQPNTSVLLVDDVVTTGATLEACATALVQSGYRVSIATLAWSSDD